jgi:hypothetical protein
MSPPKNDTTGERPPILRCKNHRSPSVFTPDALLREARRQKGIGDGTVPEICILDPDGDIVRHLVATNRARRLTSWACYHTNLHAFERDGVKYGVVDFEKGVADAAEESLNVISHVVRGWRSR